jgi:hypothetical protein
MHDKIEAAIPLSVWMAVNSVGHIKFRNQCRHWTY